MDNRSLKSGVSTLQNGKYIITRVLGQGGFGITYEAEQVSLGRKVAIKEFFMKEYCERDGSTSRVSVPSSGSRELVERFRQKFLREARMIASLNHPNIVKIYDVFEENDTAYYVMEYLPFGSLKQKVEQDGVLSEPDAVTYIHQVAEALGYIHQQNILHLDVKPSNIMLNNLNVAIVVDFGISKHYDIKGEQTSSTPVGISKGYAPWEQYLQGDVSRFTPATDIYSLGATLYYLVTGNNPPEAPTLNEEDLERPAGISEKIWSAIGQSMQPRRKDRPQNVQAFLSILDKKGNVTKDVVLDSEKTIVGQNLKAAKDDVEQGANIVINQNDDNTIIQSESIEISSEKAVNINNVVNGHEYVDLGLSVKWSTCNVGANKPEESGEYYAWGEIESKEIYNVHSYKHSKEKGLFSVEFLKYNTHKLRGKVDNLTQLELIDDVALTSWKGSWRIPSADEFQELLDNCIWDWTIQNGVNGYKITSKKTGYSNQFIFLPASGNQDNGMLVNEGSGGYYWSRLLNSSRPNFAWGLYFYINSRIVDFLERSRGCPIRPVCS